MNGFIEKNRLLFGFVLTKSYLYVSSSREDRLHSGKKQNKFWFFRSFALSLHQQT